LWPRLLTATSQLRTLTSILTWISAGMAFCGMQSPNCSSTALLLPVPPTGHLHNKQRHVQLSLILFSTFEPINITPNSLMQRNGVPMLFDSASSTNLPSLYLCRSCHVLGRVPLMPCYVRGNPHPTLPNSFGDRDGATADISRGRGNGSRLYELNLWMWRYGRGQPRKVTVAEAERRRKERTSEQRQRAAETMKRRRAERGEPGRMEAESGDD
jgi:hypothetical protein